MRAANLSSACTSETGFSKESLLVFGRLQVGSKPATNAREWREGFAASAAYGALAAAPKKNSGCPEFGVTCIRGSAIRMRSLQATRLSQRGSPDTVRGMSLEGTFSDCTGLRSRLVVHEPERASRAPVTCLRRVSSGHSGVHGHTGQEIPVLRSEQGAPKNQ